MADGHSGIKHQIVHHGRTKYFELILGYLKENSGQATMIFHLRATHKNNFVLSPEEFLKILGFKLFEHNCPHFDDTPCLYRHAFRVRGKEGFNLGDSEQSKREFEKLRENLDEAYELTTKVYQKLGGNFNLFPWAEQFNTEPKILDLESEIPNWIDNEKVPQHIDVEKKLKELVDKDRYFKTIEYSLFGTNDPLVDSVSLIFKDMGLKATKTGKGSTVDLILEVPNAGIKFGIEITGLNDAIKKRTNKINQALTFLQEKRGNEKAIILANTHNSKPISERRDLEDFTKEAVNLLKRLGIVGMTTFTLYKIWKDVKYKKEDATKIMKKIFEHRGGIFEYK